MMVGGEWWVVEVKVAYSVFGLGCKRRLEGLEGLEAFKDVPKLGGKYLSTCS